ncbi:DUF6545 domain-containing protein [Streptomyces sp. V2]|uniref:DUF6545 domain-containing protein n=1 Tax=Streptomyces sp. V2 TaxID=1424099 RepID=UPI001057EFA8|nr:DUF6545 domain-containing protein [Streptomyces sp. V2]
MRRYGDPPQRPGRRDRHPLGCPRPPVPGPPAVRAGRRTPRERPRSHRPPLRRAEFARCHRGVEIRDGSLALRPRHRPEALAWATGAADSCADRGAEAAWPVRVTRAFADSRLLDGARALTPSSPR